MITQSVLPYKWSAAHSPIEFIYDYEFQQCNAIGVYSGSTVAFIGKVAFIPVTPFATTPVAGMQVCFKQGVYVGNHIVKGFESGIVILETDFTIADYSSQNSYLIVTDRVFTLYAGYAPGEPFCEVRPRQLIATFKPEATILRQSDPTSGITTTPKLIIDISGWLQSQFHAFDLAENYEGNYGSIVDTSYFEYDGLLYMTGLFTQYQLYCDDELQFTGNVINSAISQDELNGSYVDTNRALTPEYPTVVFASCNTFLNYINSIGVWVDVIVNGQSTTAPAYTVDDILNG